MPLSLEPQALTHLLKSGLHLPAPHEPGDDPRRVCVEIGAQQGLSFELLLGIADQDPTQRNRRQPRAVPDRRGRSHLDRALLPPYQSAIVMDVQAMAGSSTTAERLGRRSPLRRVLPI